MTAPFAILVLMGPLLLLAAACVGLAAHGPLGWLAAAALLAAVGWVSWRSCRACLRWWAGTRAPDMAPGGHAHLARRRA